MDTTSYLRPRGSKGSALGSPKPHRRRSQRALAVLMVLLAGLTTVVILPARFQQHILAAGCSIMTVGLGTCVAAYEPTVSSEEFPDVCVDETPIRRWLPLMVPGEVSFADGTRLFVWRAQNDSGLVAASPQFLDGAPTLWESTQRPSVRVGDGVELPSGTAWSVPAGSEPARGFVEDLAALRAWRRQRGSLLSPGIAWHASSAPEVSEPTLKWSTLSDGSSPFPGAAANVEPQLGYVYPSNDTEAWLHVNTATGSSWTVSSMSGKTAAGAAVSGSLRVRRARDGRVVGVDVAMASTEWLRPQPPDIPPLEPDQVNVALVSLSARSEADSELMGQWLSTAESLGLRLATLTSAEAPRDDEIIERLLLTGGTITGWSGSGSGTTVPDAGKHWGLALARGFRQVADHDGGERVWHSPASVSGEPRRFLPLPDCTKMPL